MCGIRLSAFIQAYPSHHRCCAAQAAPTHLSTSLELASISYLSAERLQELARQAISTPMAAPIPEKEQTIAKHGSARNEAQRSLRKQRLILLRHQATENVHVYQHRSGKPNCYSHDCRRYRMRRQKARHVLHQQPSCDGRAGNITSEESKFHHCCISKNARPIAWKITTILADG